MVALVSVVIAWYPVTTGLDISSFVSQLRVPVLMFADEEDHNSSCCLISTARSLAIAAAGRQFQLGTYPNTGHDFFYGWPHLARFPVALDCLWRIMRSSNRTETNSGLAAALQARA